MTTAGKINPGSQAELNLLDVFIVLLKYKWLILSIVLATMIMASGYFYLSPKRSGREILPIAHEPVFFYSECLIEPDTGLMEKFNWLTLRRYFVLKVIEENNLLTEIEKAIQKEKESAELANKPVSKQDIYRWVRQNIFVTPAGNVLTLGFAASQEELPPRVINGFMNSLSEYFRKRDMGILIAKENLLRERLISAHDAFLKSRIVDEIITVVDKETKVRNAKYYGFELLDPPSTIERVRIRRNGNERKIESLEAWISPISLPSVRTTRNGMIIVLLLLTSFVVAVTLAFILEYIQNMKIRQPEKMALLKRYFSLRGK